MVMNDIRKIKLMQIGTRSVVKDALFSLERSGQKLCLVVDEEKKLLGTLSDGDIRKALLKKASLSTSVCEVMNKSFTFVASRESRSNVLDLMKARKLTVIPILDHNKKILGVHTLYGILGSEKKPNVAIIMAGGKGERLKPLTDNIPKPMVKVAGKPILERLILHLMSHGIREIYLAVNYKQEIIHDYFGDGRHFGVKIEYISEKIPMGTAGALSLLRSKSKDPLIVLNGDLVTQFDVTRMLEAHVINKNSLTVGEYKYLHTIPYGVLKIEKDRVAAITEKPLEWWHVNSGIYIMDVDLIPRIPKNEYFTMPQLIERCIELKRRVGAFEIEEEWLDVGKLSELEKARKGTQK
jgi:dTDP-glucose pyrophosphorylase